MQLSLKVICAFIILIVFDCPLSSQIYQWKDKYGNIYFTDSPPQGAEAELKKIGAERTKIEKQTALEKPVMPQKPEQKKPEINHSIKRAYSDIKVIMYLTTWCGYCRKAREYLKLLGINLTEYDIENNKAGKAEMKEKTGGRSGVPVIDIEGVIIRGFAPEEIKAAIENKRKR